MKIEKDYDINLSRQLIRVKLQMLTRYHNNVFLFDNSGNHRLPENE